jgi:nicotinamidase-related amidase
MDFQRSIVERYASEEDALLPRVAGLIAVARRAGLKVIYVVVGFRPGYLEVSPRNQSFAAIRGSGRFQLASGGSDVHPALAPAADEVVVIKHRVGAFSGTDLDMILRANAIETLVLAGIATSGVVLSTVRQAADADYHLVVVGDACHDADPEVHRILVEKVFPRQATVIAAETLMQRLL